MNNIMSCCRVPFYKILVMIFLEVFILGILWSDPLKGITEDKRNLGPENLIRFHILANSDSAEDQETKYAVRDAVVALMGQRLAPLADIDEARRVLRESEEVMVACAEEVIRQRGYSYPVTLVWDVRDFPTRGYGNVTLPAGEYESVRILIGEAQGANWWCVLFPPLCFVQESVGSSSQAKAMETRTANSEDSVDSVDSVPASNVVAENSVKSADECQSPLGEGEGTHTECNSLVEKRFFFMDFVKDLFGG